MQPFSADAEAGLEIFTENWNRFHIFDSINITHTAPNFNILVF